MWNILFITMFYLACNPMKVRIVVFNIQWAVNLYVVSVGPLPCRPPCCTTMFLLSPRTDKLLEKSAMKLLDVFTLSLSHTLHCSDFPVVCKLLRPDSSWSPLHATEWSEQWSVGEMTWTWSELTAVYWKHLSWMPLPPEFVVAGEVKRSAGGSTTTS